MELAINPMIWTQELSLIRLMMMWNLIYLLKTLLSKTTKILNGLLVVNFDGAMMENCLIFLVLTVSVKKERLLGLLWIVVDVKEFFLSK
nr:MAG TPA: hypothetical protein [Bacteriophage sp.]